VNKDELSRTIAKLGEDYAEQLPRTVEQMEELWRRLAAAELPPAQLKELLRMAHSIAGSGATFGLPHASRAARELEMFLDQCGAGGQLPGAAEQATVSALLAALMQAAGQR
jgi:HPt (histidine-containing phosphotransfer) domain-containing protein